MNNEVTYTKCQEYSPCNAKSNKYGMRTFWRADYKGESIAWGDTKKECMSEAKAYIKRLVK